MIQNFLLIFLTACILKQSVYCDTLFKIENALKDQDTKNHVQNKDLGELHGVSSGEDAANVQTLNMFLQLTDQQRDLLRGLVEKQEDRKCTGDRCGSYERKLTDDIDEVLGEIKQHINTDRHDDVMGTGDPDYGDGNQYQSNLGVRPYNNHYHLNQVQQYVPGFQDLTRNEYVIKFGHLPYGIHSNYPRSKHNAIDKEKEVASSRVNPEDFFKFYVDTKAEILTDLLGAVRSLKKKSFIPFENLLSPKQIRLLKKLQHNYEYTLIRKAELTPQITNIVFGEHSNSRILPHDLNSFKILVPQWFYDRIVTHKDIASRSQKILPLTNRQRVRLLGKIKPLSMLSSRRSNFNPSPYGVPFEMDVQGLGQINP